ncbi:MAG: hypothetical protein PVH73_01100 [Candidatus Bathyarchaeota archaeon]|jgi:hypothetical protein
MRTVEVLFVIIILLSAFFITTYFAVLPSSSQAFGTNLRELSQSTLETLDAEGILSQTVFKPENDAAWADLQKALSASLPPNIVYNLNVYNLSANASGAATYNLEHSISDASFGVESGATSLLVASPDINYTQDPQKIEASTNQSITLYILNCNDANGWWITGYTGQSLAADVYDLLSPYFTNTVLVNSTDELESLLDGNLLTAEDGETVDNAVVVNTFGEAVPISSYYANYYSGDYAEYCHFLGQTVNTYNWTWVSIVGYPFYYVTNVNYFTGTQNGYGIYGMSAIANAGAIAFLRGLNSDPYFGSGSDSIIAEVGVVDFTSYVRERCNYYGIYPAPYQTSSRALTQSIIHDYNLVANELFIRPHDNPATMYIDESTYIPAATYRHTGRGALTAIGLTRIPDIRVAALALLVYYNPTIYPTVFRASSTSVLVTLQLGQQGGA